MVTSDASQIDVIVGELVLVDGRRQTDAVHMAVLTPPRRTHGDRRHETLLVFLDLGSQDTDGLARAMLGNFERSYWRCGGPITSALRRAIGSANEHLREENRLMPISQRRRAGLVCAVLRDDGVYLAQIGPAKALLATGDAVTRFPKETREQLPLGVSSGLDIRFTHSSLSDGECLILTGESWTASVPENTLADAVRTDGAEVEEIIQVLERSVGRSTFSGMIVQFAPLAESTVSAPSTRQLPMPTTGQADTPGLIDRESRARKVAPAGRMPYPAADSDPELEQIDAPAHVPVGVPSLKVPDEVDQAGERTWRPSKPLVGFSFDGVRLDRSRQGLRRLSLALSDGVRGLLLRVLPEPEVSPVRRKRRRGAIDNVPMMAGIAVAIPLVIAFVVVTFYLQRSAAEQQNALLKQALRAAETARQAEGQDAQALWEAALAASEEALQVAPDDEEVTLLRREARAKLDEFGRVLRPEFVLLWDYGKGGDHRIAASRMQVYVLDTDEDQVTQHALKQAPSNVTGDQLTLVAYRGQNVGDAEIGELSELVWLGAGGSWTGDVLLILTADNNLLQHSLSWGLSWVAFDTQLAPDNVGAVSPYDGKLYVLDTLQNQVWRFPVSGDGFGPAEHYFLVPPPDLSNAIDMTIDGAVYILLADGKIYKFFGGKSQPYQLSDLPQPLQRPVALVHEGDATGGALYVADAGAQSIVALTKSGEFIYQIKAEGTALADLEAMTIEGESRTLFVLANGQLYAVALPRFPQPTGTSD